MNAKERLAEIRRLLPALRRFKYLAECGCASCKAINKLDALTTPRRPAKKRARK